METKEPSFEQELAGFFTGIAGGKPHLAFERKLFIASIASLAILALIGAIAWFFYFKDFPNINALFPYFIYTGISSVAVTAAIAHYSSHRNSFTCMEGMMVGMTIGMISGFLFGAIIGATNGMFIGSVFGMAVGMLTGAWCGKCCGIMGLLEGLMGGLMAGTMGAMLSVMMQYDNLALFMPILLVSCMSILAGFAFMVHSSAGKREEGKLMAAWKLIALALLLSLATSAVILFAPRTGVAI